MIKCKVCEVRLDDENWDRSCCNECGDFLCVECMDKHCCPDCDVQLCNKCTCKECNDEGPEYDNPPYLKPEGVVGVKYAENMDKVVIQGELEATVLELNGADHKLIFEAIEGTARLLGHKVERDNTHAELGLFLMSIIDPNEPSRYNECYGNDRICKCGHPYYRHFDSHEDMAPVGCKYCGCDTFEEQE